MDKVFGIDLGTTFSAITYVNEATNEAELIVDPETQEPLTPSVVMFESEDNVIVGRMAKENAVASPERVVEFVKRSIGMPKGEPPQGWCFKFGGHEYSAQEISAFILKKLKGDAETRLGSPVEQVVITVPAYFGEPQRAATAEAGRIAGLQVLGIIDEPLAAALAYGLDRPDRDQNVFIFDLGGGTFDVTVAEVRSGSIRQIAINGNPRLGGKDWDDALIEYAARKFLDRFGSNPTDDLAAYQDLQLRAIRAKHQLSRIDSSKIVVQHAGNQMVVEVTRDEFERLTSDLVGQCRDLCELVMGQANLKWTDIDTLLLVGGATRMPMIRRMVEELTGKAPSTEINPDECVAKGAAWHALMLSRGSLSDAERQQADAKNPEMAHRLKKISAVRKVTSRELGVNALNTDRVPRSFLMIAKFTEVPCEATDTFHTVEDNQREVLIQVTEGGTYLSARDCDPEDCLVLGEAVLPDLPPFPKGSPVEVTLCYNEDGILEVAGRHVPSGKTVKGEIRHPGGLSDAELQNAQRLLQRTTVIR